MSEEELRKQLFFFVCPAWVSANGCKSRVSPDSGNHTAKSNGVHREVESERSLRQTSGLTDRNFISRHKTVDETAKQVKVR